MVCRLAPGRRLVTGIAAFVVLSALTTGASAAVLQQYPIPFAVAPGAAEAIVSGPDGALWFTVPQADRIGRVTTGGVLTGFSVTPGSHPLGIAAGPDGALWFTEAAASRIGRISTAGGLAEYPIPPGSRPVGIVAGPDGALWFTENGADRIGRMATGGTFAEYALPTPEAQPVGITVGPDAALWFTELGGSRNGRIGRIDPATLGVTDFPAYPAGTLSSATDPQGITTGPDGALWFTERAGNKIGRMTVAGSLTEFDAAPGPFGIARDTTGALWFTQSGMPLPGEPAAPGLIGRLMTSGVLDLFPLHPVTGESPNDITTGPDGAIWITDGASIARVSGDLSASVPVISGLAMSHRSFHVAAGPRRTLTSFRFRLSTAAAWDILIERLVPGKLRGPGDCRLPRPALARLPDCLAHVAVATLRRPPGQAGRQSIGFTGYGPGGRRLGPGRYLATVGAISPIRRVPRSQARSISFKILR